MKSRFKIIKVDVSNLAPPEPMTVILKQLAELAHHECLLVKHRRQPFPLYEKLNEAGFSYHCVVHSQNKIDLYIFHQSSQNLFNEKFNEQFDETLRNIDITKGES